MNCIVQFIFVWVGNGWYVENMTPGIPMVIHVIHCLYSYLLRLKMGHPWIPPTPMDSPINWPEDLRAKGRGKRCQRGGEQHPEPNGLVGIDQSESFVVGISG